MTEAGQPWFVRRDIALAFALALLLTAVWTLRDWPALSVLRLPDTDDAMRLQQIRDWLGGQAFADLGQHRLGAAPGLPMHWSRLPDLVPAAIIAALTPIAGRHAAELTAVIAWPAALFALALALVGSLAARLGGADRAWVATVIAAIAYPATTLFLPGRLDHHGLQIVLLLVAARALIAPDALIAGAAAGLATAVSLAVGMEYAPLLAVAGAIVVLRWILGEARRLPGFAVALLVGLLVYAALLRPAAWDFAACDSLTRIGWRAATIAASGLEIAAAIGSRVTDARARVAVLLVTAAPALGLAAALSPACLSPYGSVDLRLARLWLAHVGEAQSIFAAPAATAIGYLGLATAGLIATACRWRVAPTRSWTVMLVLQGAAVVMACASLRAAPAAAMLGAPALAGLVVTARARGVASLAAAWLVSAGVAYPLAAGALARDASATEGAAAQACTGPAALGRLRQLGGGRLLAPMDLGAFAIAATPLDVVAAPYHRNNAGNLALYRFLLGSEAQAKDVARAWRLDYVALCPDTLSELGPAAARSPRLIGLLREGRPPAWLRPLSGGHDVPQLYAVTPVPESRR